MRRSLVVIKKVSQLIFLIHFANHLQGQTATRNDGEVFTHPAEFEQQEAVWMAARPFESDHPTLEIVIQMVQRQLPH